jgi:hypothetical protein
MGNRLHIRLTLETAQANLVLGEFSGEEFDGDLSSKAGVISEVNFAHPALADAGTDLVTA